MRLEASLKFFVVILLSVLSVAVQAGEMQLTVGSRAIRAMAGCYLVDYSYTETEGLQSGYVRDSRVYDVNTNKSIKEWIFAEEISPTRIRLQHILFGVDLAGTLMNGSILKHQSEDWEYAAQYLYDFIAPLNWDVRDLSANPDRWTRRVTNLDDGLRYQCSAAWNETTAFPEWSCDNYAPIPGRETRDMGRKDYNTLERSTRVMVYGRNWLERQANTKVNYSNGTKTRLAKELGKNWYVRLPNTECAAAQEFSKPRMMFWALLREVWDEVLVGDRLFTEKPAAGAQSRYARISEIEDRYIAKDLQDPSVRTIAAGEIRAAIEAFREH